MTQLIFDELQDHNQEVRGEVVLMVQYIDRMIVTWPEGELYEFYALHREWLGNALALLDDQLPIDWVKPECSADLMKSVDAPYRYKYGQLANVDIDKVLSRYGTGLAKYANSAPDLQGRAYHLVVKLEMFHARLIEDLHQPYIPKEDLEILKSILEGIQRVV